jgi:hypothetical protein
LVLEQVWVLAQELKLVAAWVWILELEWVMVRVQAQERVKELLPAAKRVPGWMTQVYNRRQVLLPAQVK